MPVWFRRSVHIVRFGGVSLWFGARKVQLAPEKHPFSYPTVSYRSMRQESEDLSLLRQVAGVSELRHPGTL